MTLSKQQKIGSARILGADQAGVGKGRTEARQTNTNHGILKENVLRK
jgi:hypothetical protein